MPPHSADELREHPAFCRAAKSIRQEPSAVTPEMMYQSSRAPHPGGFPAHRPRQHVGQAAAGGRVAVDWKNAPVAHVRAAGSRRGRRAEKNARRVASRAGGIVIGGAGSGADRDGHVAGRVDDPRQTRHRRGPAPLSRRAYARRGPPRQPGGRARPPRAGAADRRGFRHGGDVQRPRRAGPVPGRGHRAGLGGGIGLPVRADGATAAGAVHGRGSPGHRAEHGGRDPGGDDPGLPRVGAGNHRRPTRGTREQTPAWWRPAATRVSWPRAPGSFSTPWTPTSRSTACASSPRATSR